MSCQNHKIPLKIVLFKKVTIFCIPFIEENLLNFPKEKAFISPKHSSVFISILVLFGLPDPIKTECLKFLKSL